MSSWKRSGSNAESGGLCETCPHAPGNGPLSVPHDLEKDSLCKRFDQKMSKQSTKKRLKWNEKLNQSEGLPKVGPILPTMSKSWGEGTMVVPAPLEVDAIMKRVPEG